MTTVETPLTFAEKKEFLGQLEIFSQLDDEELTAIALLTEQFAFPKGALIIHQRDVADKLYIIRSGRVEAFIVDENGVSTRVRQYLPGAYFDDVWLFKPGTHLASVRTRTDGRMLVIEGNKFLKFLDKNKDVLPGLVLSPEAVLEIEKSRLSKVDRRYQSIKLVPEELVEFETRRSPWVLVAKTFLPFLAMILVPMGVYSLLQRPLGASGGASAWPLTIALLPGFIFALIVVFFWLDWLNDYLIITNKRLVQYEFELTTFSAKVQDTPMDQIQSVETVTPNIFSTILQLGSVQVTTAGQSNVLSFDYISEPKRVEDTIDRIRQRLRALNEGQTQVSMRQSIENYFKIPAPLTKLPDEQFVPLPPSPLIASWLTLKKWYAQVSRPFSYRVEEGNVVTYRKHIFALLKQLVWPLALMVALVLISFSLRVFAVPISGWLFVLATLFVLAWLIWRFEDWRNDTFQVTERYVIDIDRRPFGFGESRKKAQLDNLQNVNAEQPNLLAKLFNFGNVHLETAGAQANIIFENVSRPIQVQNDVFQRREKFRELQRMRTAERQRQEYAVLLDVYIQERELDRVRRRTPDFDELDLNTEEVEE